MGTPEEIDLLARDALIESLRAQVGRLKSDLAILRTRLSVAERSRVDGAAVLERAKRITKLAQLDGGRHALRSALADHDGTEDWRHFLDGRARRLEHRIADERQVLDRG